MIMEGELKKWINIFLGWKTRYFILKDGILQYSKKKNDKKIKKISMNICEIILDADDPLRIILNGGTKKLVLKAKTITDKITWLNALRY